MKQQIIDLINEKHEQSNGSCGTPIVEIINKLKTLLSELKPIISELLKEKTIVLRLGINGYMVMKK